MYPIVGRLSLLLLLISFFSLLADLVHGQFTTVDPVSDLVYNLDPFNLTPADTAAYTSPDKPAPDGIPATRRPVNILSPNITGQKGVHPHGDRLKRTLCYCSSPEAGTRNSGSSYYHMEYYNSQLDQMYTVNWTCMHRTEDNGCKDHHHPKEKHCVKSNGGKKFCFEQKENVVKADKYWFGGHKRDLPFLAKDVFTTTPRPTVMEVCRDLCDTYIGPPADRNDPFFNGLAFYKNGMDEFHALDDICPDGGKHGRCP